MLRLSKIVLAGALLVSCSKARNLAADDDRGFAELANKLSEDAESRTRGGDLGFIDKNSHLPRALMDAASNATIPGEVIGPIPIAPDYEILRLVTLRAPAVTPLSSVAEPIRQRLYRERRAQALESYIARLRSETKVEITAP